MDGVRILSESTCARMRDGGKEATLHPFGDSTTFTQGGFNRFDPVPLPGPCMSKHNNAGRGGFEGWLGMGGSVCQWNSHLDIGFGYVPTFLAYEDISNTKGALLQAEVVKCVMDLIKEEENDDEEEDWYHVF